MAKTKGKAVKTVAKAPSIASPKRSVEKAPPLPVADCPQPLDVGTTELHKVIRKRSEAQLQACDPETLVKGQVDESVKQLAFYLMGCFDRSPPTSSSQAYERIYEYLDKAYTLGCVPGKPGLAIALGFTDYDEVTNAINRHDSGESSCAYVMGVKRGLRLAEETLAECARRGQVGAIFLLKAAHGYREASQSASVALPSLNLQINFGAPSSQVGGSFGGSCQVSIPSIPVESAG